MSRIYRDWIERHENDLGNIKNKSLSCDSWRLKETTLLCLGGVSDRGVRLGWVARMSEAACGARGRQFESARPGQSSF
jgi:hypothetical protein